MLRHMRSLRKMDRDHGWIHTLLEEAENERMHLLTFLKLRKPSTVFKLSVIATQASARPPSSAPRAPPRRPARGPDPPPPHPDSHRRQGIFMNLFFLTYLVRPAICHR